MNHIKILALLLMITILTLTLACGCRSSEKKPEKQPDVVAPAFSCSEKAITARCIVTFYDTDGSRYISQQTHQICPETETIVISASEPQGQYAWKLAGDSFGPLGNSADPKKLDRQICDHLTAKTILTSILAGSGLITLQQDESQTQPIKIEGQWYTPSEPASQKPSRTKLKIYINTTTATVDRIHLEDTETSITLTAHSYNYRWLEGVAKNIPTKIDVFSTNNADTPDRQILEIKYYMIGAF